LSPLPDLRVLVVDDHAMFRYGLRALLASEAGIDVIGEAGSGPQAVTLAQRLKPDVIVIDVNMPGGDGISAIGQIAQVSPEIRALVLTMFEDDEKVFAAMRAGARGYVLKTADVDGIVRAVRAVGSGEAIFGPAIAERMVSYFEDARRPQHPDLPELTAREREVLALIAQGSSNTAIARALVLSPKTVRNHLSAIFRKLQVADRAQAIARAQGSALPGRSQDHLPG